MHKDAARCSAALVPVPRAEGPTIPETLAAVPVTAWGVARRTDHAFPAFRAFSLEGLGGVRGAAFCPDTAAGCQSYNPVAENAVVSSASGGRQPPERSTAEKASVARSEANAASNASEVVGEGGIGIPNGITRLIVHASRTPRPAR